MDINTLMRNRWTPVVASAFGFVAGVAVGHLYEQRKEQEEEGEVIVVDVAALKRDLDAALADYEDEEEDVGPTEEDKARHPSQWGGSPLDLAVTIDLTDDADQTYVVEVNEDDHSDDVEVLNIFAKQKEDGWDWEAELESRHPNKPYVIHEEEFAAHEHEEYEQSTLTWYNLDEIMADSHDTPLYSWKEVTGPSLPFGHGSSDPNSVYIRNPQLKGEYEILFDPGSFEAIVLGLRADEEIEADELKHSKMYRFRMDD